MSAAQTDGPTWQWVPVRLDLHRGLVETPDGGVTADPEHRVTDREKILRLIREQSVPALYTEGDTVLQLMVPVQVRDQSTLVARASAEGELSTGEDLDSLMENILEVPGLEYASWQTGALASPGATAVAVVQARRASLPVRVARIGARGWFDVAEATEGWVVVSGREYDELLALVDDVEGQAVVLDTDGEHRAMTVCPVGHEAVTLEWGPVRDSVTSYPENSPAGQLQAQANGHEDAKRREAARVAGVVTLTAIYGLDSVGERRLEQYARDANGRYAPESVLQLLGLPDIAAKILDGRKAIDHQPGYARVRNEGLGRAVVDSSQDSAREASRRVAEGARRNPWAVAAAAGVGLGAWMLRRKK